jgi:hypothetical protein
MKRFYADGLTGDLVMVPSKKKGKKSRKSSSR